MDEPGNTHNIKQAHPADSSVDGRLVDTHPILLIECFGQNRNDLRFAGNHTFKKGLVL